MGRLKDSGVDLTACTSSVQPNSPSALGYLHEVLPQSLGLSEARSHRLRAVIVATSFFGDSGFLVLRGQVLGSSKALLHPPTPHLVIQRSLSTFVSMETQPKDLHAGLTMGTWWRILPEPRVGKRSSLRCSWGGFMEDVINGPMADSETGSGDMASLWFLGTSLAQSGPEGPSKVLLQEKSRRRPQNK